MSEDNRAELVRLIHEHLEDQGLNTAKFVKLLDGKVSTRSVYWWLAGQKVPRGPEARAALEDALKWKRGSVREVLGAPITRKFELSEVRDWEQFGEVTPAPQLKDLSTDELMVELVRRVGALQSENELLRKHSNPGTPMVDLHAGVFEKRAFGLAASSTDAARNMEHLEGN